MFRATQKNIFPIIKLNHFIYFRRVKIFFSCVLKTFQATKKYFRRIQLNKLSYFQNKNIFFLTSGKFFGDKKKILHNVI